MGIRADISGLALDAVVNLYALTLPQPWGQTYRWHSVRQTGGGQILFGGAEYESLPIEVTGIESTSTARPRPTLTIWTADPAIAALVADSEALIGARLVRHRTLARYLDGQPDADPTAETPVMVFHVEQLEQWSGAAARFRLAEATDLPGNQLPGGTMLAGPCTTAYRGETCGYVGPPIEAANGAPISGPLTDRGIWSAEAANYVAGDYVSRTSPDGVPFVFVAIGAVPAGTSPPNPAYWVLDSCDKSLRRCRLTHGATAALPYDAFPGMSRLPRYA